MNADIEPIEVLLVEDNPGDVRLTIEALREAKIAIKMSTVNNGLEALEFLRREEAIQPDLILLDLNMPKMNGREFLREIKWDAQLRAIPVIVLTTSNSEEDVYDSYNLHANCFISKPVDIDEFIEAVRAIGDFWLSLVKLP